MKPVSGIFLIYCDKVKSVIVNEFYNDKRKIEASILFVAKWNTKP